MATKRRFEIAELFPQPRYMELGEGISELATDVRLATVNVWPVQRKALRSILTLAGVRVVANKKKYVVTASVHDPEEEPDAFDLSAVPAELQKDYYELRIQDSEVFIDAPYQDGMVWAAQTLGMLFKMMINGLAVPNLHIRDWPNLPMRGVKLDCCNTTDRMDINAWRQAIDAFSSFKLNMLGIGIYDCLPDTRFPEHDRPSEFLHTPFSDPASDNDPHSETRYRYFNVKYDRWYDKSEPSLMFQEDFFSDVITYGHERGMTVFPIFNILGSNTLLPRLVPAISARNAKGKPTGKGLCYSSPAARNALIKIFQSLLDKYFPDGLEYFHLGTLCEELSKNGECQCPKCKGTAHAKLLADFLTFIIDWLTSNGVGKIIIGANELFPSKNAKDGVLALLLKNPGMKSKLVIDWSVTANGRPCQPPKLADANKLKLESWLGPIAANGLQNEYHDTRTELDAAIKNTYESKLGGILANVQYDPAYLDHFALLGVRTWESTDEKLDTTETLRQRWAELNWFAYSDDVAADLKELDELSATPAYQLCQPHRYFTAAKKGKGYPLAALEALAKVKNATAELEDISRRAGELMARISRRLDKVSWTEPLKSSLQSMFSSAQRLQIDADHFILLAALRKQLAAKAPATAKIRQSIADGLTHLSAQLQIIENNMPDCLLWFAMQQLGCHKLFLEKLDEQLKAKTPASKLCWEIPVDWEVPEDK